MTEAGGPGEALAPGDVVWVAPEIGVGREHAGRRPALVVAGGDYLETVDALALVVPITSVDRGWPNHVEVVGADLGRRSWAMSEQVRTISRERLVGGRRDARGRTGLAGGLSGAVVRQAGLHPVAGLLGAPPYLMSTKTRRAPGQASHAPASTTRPGGLGFPVRYRYNDSSLVER